MRVQAWNALSWISSIISNDRFCSNSAASMAAVEGSHEPLPSASVCDTIAPRLDRLSIVVISRHNSANAGIVIQSCTHVCSIYESEAQLLCGCSVPILDNACVEYQQDIPTPMGYVST